MPPPCVDAGPPAWSALPANDWTAEGAEVIHRGERRVRRVEVGAETQALEGSAVPIPPLRPPRPLR